MIIELVGYIGSTLVVVSMLMSSVIKLRVINTLGSCISAAYALIIGSFPLALMNICLIIINVYNLFRLLKSENHYDLIDGRADDPFVKYFLDYYGKDIQKFFPDINAKLRSADTAYMICCDSSPAGLLVGKKKGKGAVDVFLDYTTPMYRDCSAGTFLYAGLAKKGVRKLLYSGKSQNHEGYLKKMGFVNENGVYIKNL